MSAPSGPGQSALRHGLAERLEEKCPGLSIEKTGRGKFRIEVKAILDFGEAP